MIRAAVLVAACLAFAAMTSGLLLAIHLGDAEHRQHHDSHHCLLCQQLLLLAKKFVVPPVDVAVCEVRIRWAQELAPTMAFCSWDLRPVRPRGPPPLLWPQSI